MSEFYIIFARKIFYQILFFFGGGGVEGHVPPPPSPTPVEDDIASCPVMVSNRKHVACHMQQ